MIKYLPDLTWYSSPWLISLSFETYIYDDLPDWPDLLVTSVTSKAHLFDWTRSTGPWLFWGKNLAYHYELTDLSYEVYLDNICLTGPVP